MAPTTAGRKVNKARGTAAAKVVRSVLGTSTLKGKPVPDNNGLDVPSDSDEVPKLSPLLVDGGEEVIGTGSDAVRLKVWIVQKSSSTFYKNANPNRVDKSSEGFVKYTQDAAVFSTMRENMVVKTEDGVPLLVFLVQGMFLRMTEDEKREKSQQSWDAIQELLKHCTPDEPKESDKRLRHDRERQRARCEELGIKWGRLYFAFWYEQGHTRTKQPHISTNARNHPDKVADYMRATAWEHLAISRRLKDIDPERHAELVACVQKAGSKKLEHLDQGEEACHLMTGLLCNLSVTPHKDENDALDNWTGTNAWGEGRGAKVVLQDLRIKIDQQPGDLLFMKAGVLTHSVEEIEEGQRFGHVRFTRKDVLRPLPPLLDLKIPCPVPGCIRKTTCFSWNVLKLHLRGKPPPKSRATKGGVSKRKTLKTGESTAYHWFDSNTVSEWIKIAKASYNGDGTGEEAKVADHAESESEWGTDEEDGGS